jgi:trehalose synthase
MWKERPVVASRLGGIQDQIVHGESGVLIDDPRDLGAFGAALAELLDHPTEAEQIGRNARLRVNEEFLVTRRLVQYFEILAGLI